MKSAIVAFVLIFCVGQALSLRLPRQAEDESVSTTPVSMFKEAALNMALWKLLSDLKTAYDTDPTVPNVGLMKSVYYIKAAMEKMGAKLDQVNEDLLAGLPSLVSAEEQE